MQAMHEVGNVFCLKDVAAEKYPGGSGTHDVTRHGEDGFVGSSAAAAQDQDRNGAGFHYLAHGGRIAGEFGFDYVGAELECDAGVQQQPLEVLGIAQGFATGKGFDNQRDAKVFALPGNHAYPADFIPLEIRVAAADYKECDNGVGSGAQRVLGMGEQAATEFRYGIFAGGAEGGGPIKPGDQAGQVGCIRGGLLYQTEIAEVEQEGIGLAFDEVGNLICWLPGAGNRAENKRVIEGNDQAAARRTEDTAEANVFSVLTHEPLG